jgi:putative transposase
MAPSHLQRQFDVKQPNRAWIKNSTYIRTHEGWLFLSAVFDLFSRQVTGWTMGPRIDRDFAINALLMAV